MDPAKEYQLEVVDLLTILFMNTPQTEVIKEWISFRNNRNQYSPRVDIAIGPFSIVPDQNLIQEYDALIAHYQGFLQLLYNCHWENLDENIYTELVQLPMNEILHVNGNARCFLSIEIENENSKKHFMGSMVNSASLGRMGIGIAFTQDAFRTFAKILNYLAFLTRVGKNSYNTRNFLLVTKEQFIGCCEQYIVEQGI